MGTSVHSDAQPRMSKITNDGLTWSGTGCFIASCTHMATEGVKGLTEIGATSSQYPV